MKKFISGLCLMLLLITSISANVYAEENTFTKIKLGDLYVNVPYSKNDITVEYETNSIEVKATIKDKYTGKILGIHGEYLPTLENLPQEILQQLPEDLQIKAKELKQSTYNKSIMPLAQGNYFNKIVYSDCIVGTGDLAATARLYCDFEYYTYYNYRNVTKILNHYWRPVAGNFDMTYPTSNAIIQSDNVSIKVYGGCGLEKRITITTTDENQYEGGVHITLKLIVDAGGTYTKVSSTSTTETYIMRYTVNNFQYFYSIG